MDSSPVVVVAISPRLLHDVVVAALAREGLAWVDVEHAPPDADHELAVVGPGREDDVKAGRVVRVAGDGLDDGAPHWRGPRVRSLDELRRWFASARGGD